MADCTHPGTAPRRSQALWALAVVLIALALVAVAAPAARADGDPASDVLAEQSLFLPAGRGIPSGDQARLRAVLASAARHGDPIRVALIAARGDLGAVTPLWREPARYASFLGTELANVFHGTLIVVMPDGYGVSVVGGGVPLAELRRLGGSLVGAPLAETGQATAAAAVGAVRRVAAAAGHALPAPSAQPGAPGSAGAAGSAGSAGVGPVAWIALAAGALLVVAAWTASLRARPWRRGDGVAV